MRRASLTTLFLFTLIILVLNSCTTLSAPSSAEAKPDGPVHAPVPADAANTAHANTSSEPANTAKSSKGGRSESNSNNSSADRTENSSVASQQAGTVAESAAESGAETGSEPTSEPETEQKGGAAPRATLPDYLPAEGKHAGRFLMLSPQTGNMAGQKNNEDRLAERDRHSSQAGRNGTERTEQKTSPATGPAEAASAQEDSGATGRTGKAPGEIAAAAGKTEAGSALEQQGEDTEKQDADKNNIEVIRAGKGEQVHLSLPGFGWIYDRGASNSRGIEFLSRSYADSATEFVFSAGEVGRYTLAFQQQDSSTGTSARKSIAVEVSRETVQERIAAEAAAGATTTGKGNAQAAAATGAGSRAGSESTDPVAGGTDKLELPSFSFERLENAVLARNSNNTAQQVQALLIGRKSGEATDLPPTGATQTTLTDRQRKLMLEAGELLFDTQREVLAEQLLNMYLDARREASARQPASMDEPIGKALYLLGQIYESPPPPRDERRSVEYYRRIVNFYPTDPYRRRAEERIKYLQRHFLQIR